MPRLDSLFHHKASTKGVPLEDAARQQLLNVAQLLFIYKWVATLVEDCFALA